MALAKDQLAFVLVPGSFTTPYIYHKVTAQLTAQGYTVVEAPLLSAGDRTPLPPAGMYDDAASIHDVLTTTLATGKSVVLVMLSYGGIPGTQAVKGLTRQSLGIDKPAVVQLIYLSAILLPEGMSSNERFAQEAAAAAASAAAAKKDENDATTTTDHPKAKPETETEPEPEPTPSSPYMTLDPSIYPALIFNDIPDPATRQHYFDTMPVHSALSFTEPLTYAAYRDVPSVYVFTDADQIIAPSMQHAMVDRANEDVRDDDDDDETKLIKKVVLEGAGHVAVVSRPEEVVGVLVRVAEGVVVANDGR